MVVHCVPAKRCVELLESLTGTTPSVGFVHGMLKRASGLLEEADKRIRALITLAYAVSADETPLRVAPSDPETRAEEGREIPAGCLHRALHALSAGRPGPADVHSVRAHRPDQLGGRARPLPPLRLRHDRQADPPALRSALPRCRDKAHDVRVPPTSNQAERDLRSAKIQQKISGRLTSKQRTQDRFRIRGYLSTAAKHGLTMMSALRQAILGHPWIPPSPAPT
ncbi:MAG: IS66 family transposase [Pseudonocardiaceae bacterium]